ncbi:MAG TPA: adenylate kinase [Myxococcota bacterium]|nr:adenylate kinase [Myxococcota bacterium]HPB50303.1 adenylate kinase [Myxococcota bacterium]HQP95855.1 adenylate kinase [Myxococcota bacterium]
MTPAALGVILLGPPGAGKGSEAVLIQERYGIPHISTGDMLRQQIRSGSELGKLAAAFIEKGHLVPDSVVIDMVIERLSRDDCARGFLLDGFPRSIAQAQALDEAGVAITHVILLEVDDELLITRISGRRTCPDCGRVYNVVTGPSRDGVHCDACREAVLTVRADDSVDTVRSRLQEYAATTAPLIGYYRERGLLRAVEGSGTPLEVFVRIKEVLGVEGLSEE